MKCENHPRKNQHLGQMDIRHRKTEHFVFFTLSDCYEIRENITYYRYKAKTMEIRCERFQPKGSLDRLTEEELFHIHKPHGYMGI